MDVVKQCFLFLNFIPFFHSLRKEYYFCASLLPCNPIFVQDMNTRPLIGLIKKTWKNRRKLNI